MQSYQLLRAQKLGLTISHVVPSPKSHVRRGCPRGNTFWKCGLGLVLRVGSSKKTRLKYQQRSREYPCIKY